MSEKNRFVQMPLSGAARAWLCRTYAGPLLVVLPDLRQARDFAADAASLDLPHVRSFLPELPWVPDPSQIEAQKAQRGEIFATWSERASHGPVMLVATPSAIMAPMTLGGDRFTLRAGQAVGRKMLLDWLAVQGYERVELVWMTGQYAVRGSIIDIYPPAAVHPLRLEFFDEMLETLRTFSAQTQRSLSEIASVDLQALSARARLTFASLLPEGLQVVLFEPREIEAAAENATWLSGNAPSAGDAPFANGDAGVEGEGWLRWEEALAHFARHRVLRVTREVRLAPVRLPYAGIPTFRGRLRDLEAYCATKASEGYAITVCSSTQKYLDWGTIRGYATKKALLSEGFCVDEPADEGGKKIFLGDLELAGVAVSRVTSTEAPEGDTSFVARSPVDWQERFEPGQWVVHDDYGVARFQGSMSDEGREYLLLEFADNRRLMIPVMHFHKISVYNNVLGETPKADSLKGGHWRRARARAQAQAAEAAKELLALYASRELAPGTALEPQEELESEFEKTFPYAETTDQRAAFEEISRDMARPFPMDRLVVGDVGFGKTEVALRATARAVFAGKQVVILAPTTLLVQQHARTFTSRFGAFAVRVEEISRFVPLAKQKKILQGLREGRVDVVIGTHRLLGKDVCFKNLGLVVIDEEHRFGVLHKEHLKRVQKSVDVLMLSATPIPRSLYMSLKGLRDLSLLQTPPQRRLPVLTVTGPWSESLVKNAVLREHSRGGQVFFVHNRVQSIASRVIYLQRLFPNLNVGLVHGQMAEGEMERVMFDFLEGRIDILVCTTIVESGLDIPRANTLIVDDSQDLGLAQMYQLRGRVGRREEQAYAFFLYPDATRLTHEATERLEAIAELDSLGMGYQIAQKDLQIRGGGDLVGFSQHGHATRIGFQLYCSMLEDEIRRVKGEYLPQTEVEVAFPCAIPQDYLPQESLRITLYRRLLRVQTNAQWRELRDETRDRFGALPTVVSFLFDVAWLRANGAAWGAVRATCESDHTTIYVKNFTAGTPLPKHWFLVAPDLEKTEKTANGNGGEYRLVGPGGAKGLAPLVAAMKGSEARGA